MRARKTKAASARLEGFLYWAGIIASELAKEEEMSDLAIGFTVQMRKRAVGSEGEATSSSGGKGSRRSPPNEGGQKDWAIISVDSLD